MTKLLIENDSLTCYTKEAGLVFQQKAEDLPILYELNGTEPIPYTSLYYNDEDQHASNCYRIRTDTYLLTPEQLQEIKVWVDTFMPSTKQVTHKKAYSKSTGSVVYYLGDKLPEDCTLAQKPSIEFVWNEKKQAWEKPVKSKEQALKSLIALKEEEINTMCLSLYSDILKPEYAIKKTAALDFLKQNKNSDILKAVADSDPVRYNSKDKYKKAANAILDASKRTDTLIRTILIAREKRKLLRACKSEDEVITLFNTIISELNIEEV